METKPPPRLVRWETLTKTEFDRLDRARTVVVVTCSPMEVHGPHLPLGTDAMEGEGLAERALRFLPERHRDRTFLKLPYVYVAADVLPQPGSIYFRPSTTQRVLEDLGRALVGQGFRDILVSNFHGSPRHFLAIEAACDRVSRRTGARMTPIFSLMLSRLSRGSTDAADVLPDLPGVNKKELAGETHAGLIETSMILALHGKALVDPSYTGLPRQTVSIWSAARGNTPLAPAGPGGRRRLRDLVRGFARTVRFFHEVSYAGAPAGATAEIGERLLDFFGEKAGAACGEVLDGTVPIADCHSPLWKLRFFFLNRFMVRLFDLLLGYRHCRA